eukprot:6210945-Pleurochrysis_carterae.AAC.2
MADGMLLRYAMPRQQCQAGRFLPEGPHHTGSLLREHNASGCNVGLGMVCTGTLAAVSEGTMESILPQVQDTVLMAFSVANLPPSACLLSSIVC